MDYKQKRWSLNAVKNYTIPVQSFFLKAGPGAVLSPVSSPVWTVCRKANCPGLPTTEKFPGAHTGFLLLKPGKFQANWGKLVTLFDTDTIFPGSTFIFTWGILFIFFLCYILFETSCRSHFLFYFWFVALSFCDTLSSCSLRTGA